MRPRQADQLGSFYPAWRGRLALIDLPWAGHWPASGIDEALAVLKRYDVPIRLLEPHGKTRAVERIDQRSQEAEVVDPASRVGPHAPATALT